jgi:hypothetical protein
MKEHSLGENFFASAKQSDRSRFTCVHVIASDGKRIARFICREFLRI